MRLIGTRIKTWTLTKRAGTARATITPFSYIFNGLGEEIRTPDIHIPNVALYQTEPRPDKFRIG